MCFQSSNRTSSTVVTDVSANTDAMYSCTGSSSEGNTARTVSAIDADADAMLPRMRIMMRALRASSVLCVDFFFFKFKMESGGIHGAHPARRGHG